jgi:sugar phosphate isomerase/epimerase
MPQLRLVSSLGWGFPTWKEADEARLLQAFGLRHAQVFRNINQPFEPREVRKLLGDFGIDVVSLHGKFGNEFDLSQTDEAARQRAVDAEVSEAEVCRALGGTLVVVHPGNANIGAETHSPQRVAALTRSAEQLAEAGRRCQVLYALENLQPGQMGDDIALLRRIVDQIDSPHLGINYDCGHANLTGDPVAAVATGGPRIVGTHIHDNSGAADDHWVPGTGVIDMDAVCAALGREGYGGDFTLELLETTEAVQKKCTVEWRARLLRWLTLAGGAQA